MATEHEIDEIMEKHRLWKPDNWAASLQDWRDCIALEYCCSQGFANKEQQHEYHRLHMKGWFGIENCQCNYCTNMR